MLGKTGNTLQKAEDQTSNIAKVGVKNLNFAHISTGGETEITYNALNTPAEWALSGLSNPSGSYIQSLALSRFRNNITVASSLGYTIPKHEYIVYNDRISFKTYETSPDEIIEISVSDILVGGGTLVDQRVFDKSGILAAGSSEIYLGKEFLIDPEQLLVFLNGQQVFRNDDPASDDDTGNYYYLDPNGLGRSFYIKVNASDVPISDISYRVISIGGIIDDPKLSTFLEIEKVQGQIDAMIPTLAAVAGVPESDFQAVPNSVDNYAFYETVVTLKRYWTSLTEAIPTNFLTKLKSVFGKTQYQTKYLGANKTTVGTVTDLTFNNLEPGKQYRITYQANLFTSSSSNVSLKPVHNSTDLAFTYLEAANTADAKGTVTGNTVVFTAAAATLTFEFNFGISGTLNGDGSATGTWAQLEELPNHETTTKWS